MAAFDLEPARDRTYEHVLDRETGYWISLTEYMGKGDYGTVIEQKRVALKLKLNSGELRYVCPICEQAMTLPLTRSVSEAFGASTSSMWMRTPLVSARRG